MQRGFIPDRRRDGDLTGAISTIEKKALSPCKRIVFADRASGQECRFCLLTSKQRTASSLLINDAWRHASLAAWLLQHAIPLGARLSHRSDLQRTNRPRSSQTVEKPPINDQGIDTKARYTPPCVDRSGFVVQRSSATTNRKTIEPARNTDSVTPIRQLKKVQVPIHFIIDGDRFVLSKRARRLRTLAWLSAFAAAIHSAKKRVITDCVVLWRMDSHPTFATKRQPTPCRHSGLDGAKQARKWPLSEECVNSRKALPHDQKSSLHNQFCLSSIRCNWVGKSLGFARVHCHVHSVFAISHDTLPPNR